MSISYNPKIITSGLVLCLDAANTKSYPGSGTTLYDLSGGSNNCTLTNGPTVSNNTVNLSGGTDYIQSPTLLGTGTATFSQSYCLWVKPASTAGNILSMSSVNPQGNWNMPPIAATSSTFRGKFWSNNYLTSDTYTIGNWYYVCLVFSYDATQTNAYQRLYVNGVLSSQQTNIAYSSSGSDNYIFFGQSNPGADNTGMFTGSYGPIQIYTNKALSPEEVQQNFNALRGRFGI